MRVVIIGAGCVGVTTAYEFHKRGADVTVIEALPKGGLATTFSNGGQLSIYSTPWASPKSFSYLWSSLTTKNSPLIFKPTSLSVWKWCWLFCLQTFPAAYRRNLQSCIALSLHSMAVLQKVKQETKMTFLNKPSGILHLHKDQKALKSVEKEIKMFKDYGVPLELLSPAACQAHEPALAYCPSLAFGVRSPKDEIGCSLTFTQNLIEWLQVRGVQFVFGENIQSTQQEKRKLMAIKSRKNSYTADLFVFCTGIYSTTLLPDNFPLYPVKGYALTMPSVPKKFSLKLSLMDESTKVVFTPLGQSLRVAGIADISDKIVRHSPKRLQSLKNAWAALFPHCPPQPHITPWCCMRAMTPDCTPILGFSNTCQNVLYNTSHGSLGWTQSFGCADLLASMATAEQPALATDAYSPSRFSK